MVRSGRVKGRAELSIRIESFTQGGTMVAIWVPKWTFRVDGSPAQEARKGKRGNANEW